mgnify:CR=1 FL=1
MPCICACNGIPHYIPTTIDATPVFGWTTTDINSWLELIKAAGHIACVKNCFIKLFYGGITRMARISGVDLPREKRIEIGLTYIYGIGRTSATRILKEANVNPDTRVRDLTDDEVKRLSEVINETQVVEGDLRREVALNIKRLQEIGCYRGIRHRRGLPVRGQKTKTNARTRKGPKKTVANKKK